MKFLSGVAEDGKGSAALPLTRRPDRLLSHRAFNLLVVSVAAAVMGIVAARLVFSEPPQRTQFSTAGASLEQSLMTSPVPSPSTSVGALRAPEDGALEYAVGLHELRGLPADAAPGTPLQLWVAWDEAYADGPQVQKLVKAVTVSRYIEPVIPEGPVVVVLSVPEKSMRAVMYGDLYGSFSVATPTN